MTPKSAPRAAIWFLNRFGSNTEDESVMGDLSEQYQRGRGSVWDLIALPSVPALLLIGGIGGMKIPLPKGEGGPRQRAG